MTWIQTGARAAPVLSALLLLSACSSGPNEAEMRAAFESQMGGLAIAGAKSPIKEFEKIGCEKSGEAYLCDVRIKMEVLGIAQERTSRVRFIKSSSGWVISM